jgi:hypothetical protein
MNPALEELLLSWADANLDGMTLRRCNAAERTMRFADPGAAMSHALPKVPRTTENSLSGPPIKSSTE